MRAHNFEKIQGYALVVLFSRPPMEKLANQLFVSNDVLFLQPVILKHLTQTILSLCQIENFSQVVIVKLFV